MIYNEHERDATTQRRESLPHIMMLAGPGGTARNREGRAIKMTLPVLIEERADASGKV